MVSLSNHEHRLSFDRLRTSGGGGLAVRLLSRVKRRIRCLSDAPSVCFSLEPCLYHKDFSTRSP